MHQQADGAIGGARNAHWMLRLNNHFQQVIRLQRKSPGQVLQLQPVAQEWQQSRRAGANDRATAGCADPECGQSNAIHLQQFQKARFTEALGLGVRRVW